MRIHPSNQPPNCLESLIARHTRSRGARKSTFFSIRSVFVAMSNLRVALTIPTLPAICNRKVAPIVEQKDYSFNCYFNSDRCRPLNSFADGVFALGWFGARFQWRVVA